MNEKNPPNDLVEALSLERGDIFVWQNRMYAMIQRQADFTYLDVKQIASYDPSQSKWVGCSNNHVENFNGYAIVKKISMPTEWQFGTALTSNSAG